MRTRDLAKHRVAVERLLSVYRRPRVATELDPSDWTRILAASRRSRTMGHIELALREGVVAVPVDPQVRVHLESVSRVIAHRRRMVRWELVELGQALQRSDVPVLLLKGAAYEVNLLPLASGRASNDVDILVRRDDLADVERTLSGRGWRPKKVERYDERYYRDWSHELPPFTHPDRGIEVDVHHAITPAMRGPGIDTEKLIAASIEVEFDGHRRFRVLQPIDQLIHCAIHTFKDSDLTLRLRETMDFDLLYRHYRELDPDLDDKLVARAIELGIPRPLWWSIHFARRWLGSPIPERLLEALPAPSEATVRVMNWLCDRAMLPGPRMERTGLDRLAAIVLLARYHHQRLPMTKLIPHLLNKSSRRLMQPKEEPGGP